MNVFLNILVILLAIIAFLVLYYLSLKRDQKARDFHLSLKNTDYEMGEEIGVDNSNMYQETKTKVKEEKKIEESVLKEFPREEYPLREYYNKNYIRLFARDPGFLFAYWEIKNPDFYQNEAFLRLVNTQKNNSHDIRINHQARDWYLQAEPANNYYILIGFKKNGVFYPLIQSNEVTTPLNQPSAIVDEQWMTIEELSKYSYRIDMGSISLIKEIEARKMEAKLEADSYSLVKTK
ncbi:DUF4912 domain-containing protein [Halocella sp. SP3-1]|uniref:DUF4912 domain-containing protein n=1 Tax=Halocella sp. SP3-1 TaxID=2382161 RepID=UPI000F7629F6|nr:DUF4912 domain-containing protein [Halocella sp. SP3-1]AZO94124.1 DUF4912 domain-containing protein [Halocella sp. SP3-1]